MNLKTIIDGYILIISKFTILKFSKLSAKALPSLMIKPPHHSQES